MSSNKTKPQIFVVPEPGRASAVPPLTEAEARAIVERTTPRAGLVLPRPEPKAPSDDVQSAAPAPGDPHYLRALTAPDRPDSGEGDYRPRWVRAGMPREEWERARRANDAALRLAKPGSTDFSRLMEVRVRLHLPPPEGLTLEAIDDFKAARLGPVVGRFGRWSGRQVALGLAILAMLGLVSYLAGLLLFGSPRTRSATAQQSPPIGAPIEPAQATAPAVDASSEGAATQGAPLQASSPSSTAADSAAELSAPREPAAGSGSAAPMASARGSKPEAATSRAREPRTERPSPAPSEPAARPSTTTSSGGLYFRSPTSTP